MTKIDFAYIDAAVHPSRFKEGTSTGGPSDEYSNAATWAAQRLIAAAKRDPVAFKAALDEYRTNPYTSAFDVLLLPSEVEEIGGFTGFMWGWAVQTVARLLEQQPVPNGALVTIG